MEWSFKSYWVIILAIAVVIVVVTPFVRRKLKRGEDIKWPEFPEDLSWADPTASKSDLARIYKYAIDFSGCSIVWYQSRRQPKRVAGFLLRVAALVATFGAGLVPLAEDITPYTIEPQVSTLLLALAGLFVAIDNLGGYTSGWVRYMLAQQKIERARDTFFMEWNSMQLGSSEVKAMLEKAKVFLLCVGKIVDDETMEWATEFQNALKELERARKAAAETPRTSGIEITVRNPATVNGWTLEIDGNLRGNTTGKRMAVSDVPIGDRKVRASGKSPQGNKDLSDEKIVKVEGGATITCELELS